MSSPLSVLSFQLGSVAGLLPETIVYRLGWTLVHFVWQGALVALLVAAVLAALRRHSANARYVAGCAGLLLMVVAAGVTVLIVGSPADKLTVAAATVGAAGDAGATAFETSPDSERISAKPPLVRGGSDGGQEAYQLAHQRDAGATQGGRDARPPRP